MLSLLWYVVKEFVTYSRYQYFVFLLCLIIFLLQLWYFLWLVSAMASFLVMYFLIILLLPSKLTEGMVSSNRKFPINLTTMRNCKYLKSRKLQRVWEWTTFWGSLRAHQSLWWYKRMFALSTTVSYKSLSARCQLYTRQWRYTTNTLYLPDFELDTKGVVKLVSCK